MEAFGGGCAGELRFRRFVQFTIIGTLGGDVFGVQQSGGDGIVEVGGIVGDFIGEIDQLGFERRAQAGQIFVQDSGFSPGSKSWECLAMPSRTSKVRFKPGKRA